ncbi:MAG: GrpB family protein [Acidaminobacteraceae bacterium]
MKTIGWSLMSTQENPYFIYSFCKGYTKNGFAERVFHLHVRHLGDWSEFYFIDYLKDNKDVADEYVKLKMKLINKYRKNRDAYTDAKSEFVKLYTEKAREYYGLKYKTIKLNNSK